MRILIAILTIFVFSSNSFGQVDDHSDYKNVAHIEFLPASRSELGTDYYGKGKVFEQYEQLTLAKNAKYPVPYLSLRSGEQNRLNAVIKNFRGFDTLKLLFYVNDSLNTVPYTVVNDTLLTLFLPRADENYSLTAKYKGRVFGKVNLEIYDQIFEQITIVSLLKDPINSEELTNYLNSIYLPANIQLKIRRVNYYSDSLFNENTLFDNPSPSNDRYTQQMRDLRDAYFNFNTKAPKNSYYIFIIPGFINNEIKGYMARNRAMGFISAREQDEMFHSIARQLGHGIGMLQHYWLDSPYKKGKTSNLMDFGTGVELTRKQWVELRHSSNSFVFYDPDEDIKTNNGMVAYYFWEENDAGVIELNGEHPLNKISRPYKKNFLSYHLNVEDILFRILWRYKSIIITYWHIIAWSTGILIWFISRIILRHSNKKRNIPTIRMIIYKWSLNTLLVVSLIFSNKFVNRQLSFYEITSGLIEDFKGQDLDFVRKKILNHINLKKENETKLSSQIMLKQKNNWYMKRRKKVLYFDVFKDSTGSFSTCKFITDKDSLVLSTFNYQKPAESHYAVFNFYNDQDSLESQKAYNHLGIEISDKLKLDDAAKRILIFVNGYRPTSVGHNFEDNFSDIRKNGLEFPQSSNLIYSFDRFDYWHPWQNIDSKFKKRINPNDVYYADGHFSVSTSNYRSILNFTRITAQYPKRCKNPKGHTCWKTTLPSTGILGNKKVDTYDLLPTDPNRSGFKERVKNGRIAARNLLMMFNEIPNRSSNDTLYIVAHSMGYAYSLGMIEELRGKIHFGGFYIIAPENASQGKVNTKEWMEIWQYGSKWNNSSKDAPCLQDGVAPQAKAKGLKEKHRAYIPANQFKRKGFFDSHFVGHYSWIFQLDENEKGYIKQR